MPPNTPRASIIGPASGPEAPFPLRMRGAVEKGFGRGSKELGIPTANLPVTSAPWISTADSGVYFGRCGGGAGEQEGGGVEGVSYGDVDWV
ncbi:hypothetical protein V500_04323 [Pseudogymnoascus sp. VKM F-4518 (FW-2643)]|nr:hypothetical protein V500_04323 [Pseudogymnoascus sp. VKM F-4518 (FW-2643)]